MDALMAALYLTLLIILLYLFKIIINHIFNYIELQKIPGPPTYNIIVGNCAELYGSQEMIFQKLREYAKKYPIYHLTVCSVAGICLQLPDDFELVLSNSKNIDKSLIYNLLHGWLGNGLLTSQGQHWFTRRKILTPAFHFNILQQFIQVFNEETEKLVKTFQNLCHEPITIDSYITEFTLKTIAETAMGTKLQFTSEKEIKYRKAIIDLGEILVYKLVRAWLIVDILNFFSPKYSLERKSLKMLHKFTQDVIDEREKNFQKVDINFENHNVYKSKKRLAKLDLLLTAKNEEKLIDSTGVREEVDTFMFEGHDTTSVAICFALMLLACHKDVQNLVLDEITSVMGNCKKKPTYNDLQEMKYLERVLKEVLRLYPSVHFISRKLGEEVITTSGYKLPKNTIVHLHIYDIHHNPEIYPDPEKFDPDRFLPESSKTRHPFAYVPFSAGPRNCIGQKFAMLELKATICGILANFILEPIDTPETIVLAIDLVLRTKDGIKIKFVPRG